VGPSPRGAAPMGGGAGGAGPDEGPGAAPVGAVPDGSQYTRLGSPISRILRKQEDGTVKGHSITPAVDWHRGRPRFCTRWESTSIMA